MLPEGMLRSLLISGVIAGVGSVLVFLPQIMILFLFIILARGFRLYGPRGLPDGPDHGRRRTARARLHSPAVELRLRHSRR